MDSLFKTLIKIDTPHIKPIGTDVVVRVNPEEYERLGSLLLGDVEMIYSEKRRYNPAEHAIRRGVVTACKHGLKVNGGDYVTTVEVEVGDMVYFDFFAGLNATVLQYEDAYFYVLKYTDLYVRVRNGEVYPLNGIALCTDIESKDLFSIQKYEPNMAKVEYIGQIPDYEVSYTIPEIHGEYRIDCPDIYLESESHTFLSQRYKIVRLTQFSAKYERV